MKVYDAEGNEHEKEPIDAKECIDHLGFTEKPPLKNEESIVIEERYKIEGAGQKWSVIDTADGSVVKADVKKAEAKSTADEMNKLNEEK